MRAANEQLIRRLFDEVWSQGRLEGLDEIYAENFQAHYRHPPVWNLGPAGVRQVVSAIRCAFPDYREDVKDLICEGDKVVARITIEGTHQGSLGRLSPTGRKVNADEIVIFRIEGGKVIEQWGVPDLLEFYQQLGAIPAGPF